MVVDREYELRRLRRHLHVQENAVRAAATERNRLRGKGVPAAWKARAERIYAEAVAGRDGFIKMIKELEETI